MEADAEQLEIKERKVFLIDKPEHSMAFNEMLKGIQRRTKLPIIGVSEMRYPEYTGFTQSWVFESPQISFYADVAEVEVDPETGEIKILNLYYAHDCGTAINPLRTEGQLEGSAELAIGMTLSEQMLYDKGQPLNTSFLDYKIPVAADMPRMTGEHVEPERVPSVETGPWGAKEAGEGATVAVAPAIINALHDATGIWFKNLPVTPDKVLKALREKRED
jgi:4-hydroxybenzoyl-CoA reductase subunit alpha